MLDTNGKKTNLTIGTHINVSDLKAVEEALHLKTEYLEKLIDFANAPIVVMDGHYNITRFNAAFEALTGYLADDVLGKHAKLLFPEHLADKVIANMDSTGCKMINKTDEVIIECASGILKTVLWNSAAICEDDGITKISTVAQVQDITERKLAEEYLFAPVR